MEQTKKIVIDLLIVTAGVLIALKIKERLDKARLASLTK